VGPARAVDDEKQRCQQADDHAFQDIDEQHAEQGGKAEYELVRRLVPERRQLARDDEMPDRVDDQGGKDRLRQRGEQRRQEEHCDDRHRPGDDVRDLGVGAGALLDRRP
jgi:hypothetical protein